jgi:hypothetical protein
MSAPTLRKEEVRRVTQEHSEIEFSAQDAGMIDFELRDILADGRVDPGEVGRLVRLSGLTHRHKVQTEGCALALKIGLRLARRGTITRALLAELRLFLQTYGPTDFDSSHADLIVLLMQLRHVCTEKAPAGSHPVEAEWSLGI